MKSTRESIRSDPEPTYINYQISMVYKQYSCKIADVILCKLSGCFFALIVSGVSRKAVGQLIATRFKNL